MRVRGMKFGAVALSAALLGGCSSSIDSFNVEPPLTPVGQGLNAAPVGYPLSTYQPNQRKAFQSLWVDGRNEFFKDPRAKSVGDVLTVQIEIDDKATLDNRSDRARDSSADVGFGFFFGFNPSQTEGEGEADIATGSRSKGQGAIDRKEEINLQVAAIVTQVLPNGNLMVSGSQEVRVNFEVRVLNIVGIVRPRDISSNNTITYDKIAEARVSYGGRGRLSEVQQPPWGQQLYDRITPF